jgi:hypothetical protein
LSLRSSFPHGRNDFAIICSKLAIHADGSFTIRPSLLDETARREASDYPGVGPMGPNAAHRSRDSERPRFVQILS